MNKKVGKITKEVIEKLNLDIKEDTPIFIGETNIEHIKARHLEDYKKYGNQIPNIISNPTYLARDEKKNSREYIKKYIPSYVSETEKAFLMSDFYCPNAFTYLLYKCGSLALPSEREQKIISTIAVGKA